MLPKLVRDWVPDKIVKDGKVAVCKSIDDHNIGPFIFNKIREEVAELQYECCGPELNKEKMLEEFADVYEILGKLAELYGITTEMIFEARYKKIMSHGKFKHNIILYEVLDNKNNNKKEEK